MELLPIGSKARFENTPLLGLAARTGSEVGRPASTWAPPSKASTGRRMPPSSSAGTDCCGSCSCISALWDALFLSLMAILAVAAVLWLSFNSCLSQLHAIADALNAAGTVGLIGSFWWSYFPKRGRFLATTPAMLGEDDEGEAAEAIVGADTGDDDLGTSEGDRASEIIPKSATSTPSICRFFGREGRRRGRWSSHPVLSMKAEVSFALLAVAAIAITSIFYVDTSCLPRWFSLLNVSFASWLSVAARAVVCVFVSRDVHAGARELRAVAATIQAMTLHASDAAGSTAADLVALFSLDGAYSAARRRLRILASALGGVQLSLSLTSIGVSLACFEQLLVSFQNSDGGDKEATFETFSIDNMPFYVVVASAMLISYRSEQVATAGLDVRGALAELAATTGASQPGAREEGGDALSPPLVGGSKPGDTKPSSSALNPPTSDALFGLRSSCAERLGAALDAKPIALKSTSSSRATLISVAFVLCEYVALAHLYYNPQI